MNIHRMLVFLGLCLLMAAPELMEAATVASERYCPKGYYAYREDVTQTKPSCLNSADFFQKKKDLQNSSMDFAHYQQESLKFAQTDLQYTAAAKKAGLNVEAANTASDPVNNQCSEQSCKPNYQWNANACACTSICTALACPSYQKWNAATCKCVGTEANSSGGGSSTSSSSGGCSEGAMCPAYAQ